MPSEQFTLALSVALYAEWQAAPTRPEHLSEATTAEGAPKFLRFRTSTADLHDVHYLWRPFLRDPDDDLVLECAVASGAAHIVTHSVRDFAGVDQLGITATAPADFLAIPRSTT